MNLAAGVPRRFPAPARALVKRAVPLACAVLAAGLPELLAAQEPVPPHETFTIHSAVLGETRRINVYLPPGYAAGGHARYPVLYMPDGGVQEDFPHVAATVDAGIRAGEMRRMIVVGIENTERRRDMTGPTEVESDRRIAPRVGGSAAFRGFIERELIPEVRRRYRAADESAIIGESLAGLFIVETFLLHPGLFDVYIALDPSLWWHAGELVRTADERLRSGLAALNELAPTTFFMASANEEDLASAAAHLAEVLDAHTSPRLRWQYRPRPDLTHATIYRAMAPQVLRELFPQTLSIRTVVHTGDERALTDPARATPLRPGTRARRESVGAFSVIREEFRSRVPVPHVQNRWTRIHLAFQTPDRRVSVVLTDNGSGLSAQALSTGCTVWVDHLQYGQYDDERHLFDAMRAALSGLTSGCLRGIEGAAGYPALLEAAAADYPAAIRRMKARVARAFGPVMERCNPPDPEDIAELVSSHANTRCGQP